MFASTVLEAFTSLHDALNQWFHGVLCIWKNPVIVERNLHPTAFMWQKRRISVDDELTTRQHLVSTASALSNRLCRSFCSTRKQPRNHANWLASEHSNPREERASQTIF